MEGPVRDPRDQSTPVRPNLHPHYRYRPLGPTLGRVKGDPLCGFWGRVGQRRVQSASPPRRLGPLRAGPPSTVTPSLGVSIVVTVVVDHRPDRGVDRRIAPVPHLSSRSVPATHRTPELFVHSTTVVSTDSLGVVRRTKDTPFSAGRSARVRCLVHWTLSLPRERRLGRLSP